MLRRASPLRRPGPYARGPDTEDLVIAIRRLVREPGYTRAKVTSRMLCRYLPEHQRAAEHYEPGMRARIEAAALDPGTLQYLIRTTLEAREEIRVNTL